jgi:hypothetical protein
VDNRIKIILYALLIVLFITLFFFFEWISPFIIFLPFFCFKSSRARNLGENEPVRTQVEEEREIPEPIKTLENENFYEERFIKCSFCRNEIKEKNLRFCPHCGTKIR